MDESLSLTPQLKSKVNLLDWDWKQIKDQLTAWGEPPFRAEQILRWIYHYGVRDWEAMTDVRRTSRAMLAQKAELRQPHVAESFPASDGTIKWKVELADGAQVETVYIPEKGRGTLCLSSQVGCPLACTFCATGQQGFQRNLTLSEVMGQVAIACNALQAWPGNAERSPITNVVFMGMGEPLLNLKVVQAACELLLHPKIWGLSKRRVTLSTAGVVPGIEAMVGHLDVALAISLHAPNDPLRSQLMPVNLQYPLQALSQAVERYQRWSQANRSGVTLEYLLLEGVNDTPELADQLARWMAPFPAKVNLIPWNAVDGVPFQRSSEARINLFAQRLLKHRRVVTVRRSRGDATQSACGQLVGKVRSRWREKLEAACKGAKRCEA